MKRFQPWVLVISALLGSWLGMQAVHELGHVAMAGLTGGRVAKLVLHPLTLSRTELAENPHPLAVVWAGPAMGVILPALLWGLSRLLRYEGAFVLRFFAGFCLIANGAYLAVGSFDRIGDAGDMLRLGTPIWVLWLCGAVGPPIGLRLWHGQGRNFGLGRAAAEVRTRVAYASLAALVALVILGLCVGG